MKNIHMIFSAIVLLIVGMSIGYFLDYSKETTIADEAELEDNPEIVLEAQSDIQKIQEVDKWESWAEYKAYIDDICRKDLRVIIPENNLLEIDCLCEVCLNSGADAYAYEPFNQRCNCYKNHNLIKEFNMGFLKEE